MILSDLLKKILEYVQNRDKDMTEEEKEELDELIKTWWTLQSKWFFLLRSR